MPRFELKQSTRHITLHAGLFLIGQCLVAAGCHLIDNLFQVAKGQIRISDIIKSYIGLLALGKSDFDAIGGFRQVVRSWQKQKRNFRLVVRLVERTIDKKGQVRLFPEYQLEGWWTSLEEKPERVIELYAEHATHEQFHSEIKSDLDLEHLPSGKFDCNELILHLAMLAYNSLRLIGQMSLLGEFSPVRHPAKRRRIKTVLQEIMYRAAQFIHKARQRVLDFGQHCPAFQAFVEVQGQLLAAGRSP